MTRAERRVMANILVMEKAVRPVSGLFWVIRLFRIHHYIRSGAGNLAREIVFIFGQAGTEKPLKRFNHSQQHTMTPLKLKRGVNESRISSIKISCAPDSKAAFAVG